MGEYENKSNAEALELNTEHPTPDTEAIAPDPEHPTHDTEVIVPITKHLTPGYVKLTFKYLMGVGFMLAGILHFRSPDPYIRLMPPYLPFHRPLVYLSGGVEAGLGFLLLFPATQRFAAWGLIATLAAIFPANIQGAITAGTAHPAMPASVSPLLAWLRLPLQPLMMLWAYWFTREP